MKQIALSGRTLLRKILTALSLGAVAFTFQACYGPPPRDEATLRGTVKSSDTEESIPGISVSAYNEYDHSFTDRDGNYRLFVRDQKQTILFKDVDGAANGEFYDKEVAWKPGDGPLNVVLERKE